MKHCSFAVLFVSVLSIIIILALASASHAQYSIIQLTNNLYDDPYVQINENGYVVWRGCFDPGCGLGSPDAGDYEILLYDGISTIRLADNDRGYGSPQISSSGHVVWVGYDGSDNEIFLYDGTSTTQITNNDYPDGTQQINDNGYVVWHGSDDGSDTEILLYNGTSITQLTDNDYSEWSPQINNNGHVVWEGCDTEDCGVGGDGDYEIFLFDGTTTIQLTNNDHSDENPQISNNGYVVWEMCEGGTSYSCTGGDYEIFLYNGTTTTQLTDNEYDDMVPQINSSGSVVWRGGDYYDESAWEIFLYDGTSTTQVSTGDFRENTAPQIDNNGHVVWEGCDTAYCGYGGGPGVYGDTEILFYDGTSMARITNNSYMDRKPRMNDRGEIVWWSYETDFLWNSGEYYPQLRLAVPCALGDDPDDDGYVSTGCGGDDCADGNPNVNPGMTEIPGNGYDDDCDPTTPSYPDPANTVAASYGNRSLLGSGLFNSLALLLIPIGGIILLRVLRRKR